MQISLARALKEKNRIAAEFERKMSLVKQDNTHIAGDTRRCNVRAVYEKAMALFEQLVILKKLIASANTGIAPLMVELDETKGLMRHISQLDSVQNYHLELENTNVNVVISPEEREIKIDALQKRINQLQDQIDEYNSLTKIDIPEWN